MRHSLRGSRRLLACFSASALVTLGMTGLFAAGASAHPHGKRHLRSHGSTHTHGGRHFRSHDGHHGKMAVKSQAWGMVDSQAANLYTLSNGNGMSVNITNYGGVVQSITVPSNTGTATDVALGFPSLADYVSDFTQGAMQTPWPLPGGSGNTFFGAIIGRYANRIANASFTMSCDPKICANNGVTYHLDANNGPNTLHGGYLGWNTAVWAAKTFMGHDAVGLKLTDTFPAGEGCYTPITGAVCNTPTGGFPAAVKATVTYLLTKDNALLMKYNVVNLSTKDATVVNVTNHAYFNLAGESSGSVYDQYLAINANQYQPVDLNLIPTNFANVAGTAYDFRTMKPIGQDIRNTKLPDGGTQKFPQLVIAHGYDNNWVLNGSGYRLAAVAMDKQTGIVLSELTDQPGVQFYSGNFLVGDLMGTSGTTYRQTDGFTLETQHYPDAPHHIGDPAWPSVVLNPGATFNSTTAYKFSVAGSSHHRRRF